MRREYMPRRRLLSIGLLTALVLCQSAGAFASHINMIVVDGSINPASADYIIRAIEISEDDGAAAVLIELDTPGGLVSSSQDIIKAMLNAEVPIIVYVTPRGAWAASAGTFITIAANIAAMTPGSSIGAAHPVSLGGGGGQGKDEDGNAVKDVSMEKAENLLAAYMESIAKERNRNVEWAVDAVRNSVAVDAEEALELGVIDLIAQDREELLEAIDGREVVVSGDPMTLEVAGAEVRLLEMSILQGIFNFLADPNVAVILMLAGLMGLYIEFNNPGLILPGVVGAICLLLTGIALQILPFSWVGLILILLGLGLLIAEMFVTSYGALFAAGIICFLLGGTMVFDAPEVSDLNVDFFSVLLPSVLGMGGFAGLIVFLVGRSLLLEQTAGVDEMIGLVGQASTSLSPEGKIFIRGEYWNVESDQSIEQGEPVEVVAVEGLKLRVRRASEAR